MSFTILADRATDEDAFFAARRTLVTATDVSKLIRGGAGTWAAIRAEKNGVRTSFSSRAMAHGTEREPVIAQFALLEFGLTPCSSVLVNPELPLYGASPDALADDASMVGEIKTTLHDWQNWADVPPQYADQMLWQMFVTGARAAKLIFEPHDDYVPLYPYPKVFDLDYDENRVTELRATADEFLASDGEISEEALQLDSLLTQRLEAKDRAGILAADIERLDELIRNTVDNQPTRFEGTYANLTLSADGTATKFDSVAFKAADPATYTQYAKATPVKGRLTITPRKAQ